MPSATVKIEGGDELLARMRELNVNVGRVLGQALDAAAKPIVELANNRAPARLITTERKRSTRGRVALSVGFPRNKWYWQFWETGAAAHRIRAKRAKALTFDAGGEQLFRRLVSHPGMAARPFLRPAFDEGKGAAIREATRVLRQAVERGS